MKLPNSDKFRRRSNRLAGFEKLESRRVLDCAGISSVQVCVPGDSNGDEAFDQQDLIQVFQAAKYGSGTHAGWNEGDWNRDGTFDTRDVVTVFQAATYLQGNLVDDLSSLIADIPTYRFGPPITIANSEQLNAIIVDAAVQAIEDATDFNRQTLLLFSWGGSGGDRLIVEPAMVGGIVNINFRYQQGGTADFELHHGLLAVSKEAEWNINTGRRVHDDSSHYEFHRNSRLVVTGGFAGARDEYTIDGSFTLLRNADGSASFSQVDAVLRGGGLSSLDGEQLDSVLHLSELTGLQVYESGVVFTGLSRSVVIQLYVVVKNQLTIVGGDFPPCCDFFDYEIDATASAVETPL